LFAVAQICSTTLLNLTNTIGNKRAVGKGETMKIAVGSDERTALTDAVVELLREQGQELRLYGPLQGEGAYWPAVARQVAEAVAGGEADEGILFCWTGTGVSLAANKVPGIRAALCDDAETARGARLWNDANVLCLSIRRTSPVIAGEILESWFATKYEPNDVDDACLAQVAELDAAYRASD
jgi:ribose 5-phosphate isomerase B